ncbi:Uncharacterised protein [Mycobacteroides abscessus subsp. abscessus]|nr:Uncharacterised protein [Mycobacteroides abscessus subsp. abscessus]
MGDQVAGEHRRRDAVLVADRHRIHAMTDGFLIGIDEIGICRAYQPFEPRKGFHMAGAEGCRDARQHARGDHRAGNHRRGRGIRLCGKNVIAQQPTGFISRQHAPTRGGGDSDGASIGVGVEGDRQGRVHLGGPGQHRVGGTPFLGIRKLDSGKVRIRLELLFHQVDVGDARGIQGGHGGGTADSVKRGEDDT